MNYLKSKTTQNSRDNSVNIFDHNLNDSIDSFTSDNCIEEVARSKSVMLLPKGYHSTTCQKMQNQYWDNQLVTDRLNDIENKDNSKTYLFLVHKIKNMAERDQGLQNMFQKLKACY